MSNNKINNEKFEKFIEELNAVEFKNFDKNKGYKENFKSLMKYIDSGLKVVNEYKNYKECRKDIPLDCANRINKQRDMLARKSRQKSLALDGYKKLLNY